MFVVIKFRSNSELILFVSIESKDFVKIKLKLFIVFDLYNNL